MTNITNNLKNTVIQTLFTKPFYTEDELKKVIDPYISKTEATIASFITEVNDLLNHLGYELRSIVSDYTDVKYYGICQNLEDSSASESLGLKAEQVQLYYKFIEAVINAAQNLNSTVTVGEVLDLAPENMAQSAAQSTINKFCELGYCEIIGDKVRIGPRGLLEFRPTFVQMEGKDEGEDDIHSCMVCLDFILAGVKCSQCNCFLHKRCLESLNQEKWVCPYCKTTEPYIEFGM